MTFTLTAVLIAAENSPLLQSEKLEIDRRDVGIVKCVVRESITTGNFCTVHYAKKNNRLNCITYNFAFITLSIITYFEFS